MEHGEVQPIEMEMGRSCHRYDVQCSQHNVQLPHQVTRILVFDKIGDRHCKINSPLDISTNISSASSGGQDFNVGGLHIQISLCSR